MASEHGGSVALPRWPALVGGALMNVAIGTYYAWSVFVPALEHDFGWTRTQVSWVPSIQMIFLASMFVLAGAIQERVGTRLVSAIGGALFCGGLLFCSWIHSLPMLYLTGGVMVGIGLGFGYLAPITVGSKWFPDQRGLVVGLAIGIFAAGSGIFGPIGSYLIDHVGWRATFQILAGIFFVFTMAGSYMMKDPPEGYEPPRKRVVDARRKRAPIVDVPTTDMLRMPTFYRLWVAYWLGTTAGTMVISQLVPFARAAGWSGGVAAFAITIGAFGSASGRFFSGWLSDHLGRLPTVRTILVTSMIATPSLYLWRGELVPFCILLFVVYYCYGTQLSVYTALSADFYGVRYLGVNYGLLLMAWGCAGLLGPSLGAKVFVMTGHYQWAFFASAALALVALFSLAGTHPPQEATEQHPSATAALGAPSATPATS